MTERFDWMNEQIMVTAQVGYKIFITKVKTLRVTDNSVYVEYIDLGFGNQKEKHTIRLSKKKLLEKYGHRFNQRSIRFVLLRNELPRVQSAVANGKERVHL